LVANDGTIERSGQWIQAAGQMHVAFGLGTGVDGRHVFFATNDTTEDLAIGGAGAIAVYGPAQH
jgi:hypothetical protein